MQSWDDLITFERMWLKQRILRLSEPKLILINWESQKLVIFMKFVIIYKMMVAIL